jgi:hypothetical protein
MLAGDRDAACVGDAWDRPGAPEAHIICAAMIKVAGQLFQTISLARRGGSRTSSSADPRHSATSCGAGAKLRDRRRSVGYRVMARGVKIPHGSARNHRSPCVAAFSNFLGSVISIPFAQAMSNLSAIDILIFAAAFGFC